MPSQARGPSLAQFFQKMWIERGLVARLLWPLAQIFQLLAGIRRQLYRWRVLKVEQVDALVVIVGNVIAGGAGKTPTVIALVQHWQSLGLPVGVISRGYGRNNASTLEVVPESRPKTVGDEPLLVRRSTHAPVYVGPTRYAAARALLRAYPETQVIVCDDGLQHYGLHRDLEVCVFDNRGCGNGWTLPAGPLRETWPRSVVASSGQDDRRLFVLHTGESPAFSGYTAQRSLAPYAIRNDGSRVDLATLVSDTPKPLMAVAGIAQPDIFFSMLKACGLHLAVEQGLPDHYDFDSYLRNADEGYQLICTEKDAMKLWHLDPQALAVPLMQTMEPAFWVALDAQLQDLRATKLSSRHGHTIT